MICVHILWEIIHLSSIQGPLCIQRVKLTNFWNLYSAWHLKEVAEIISFSKRLHRLPGYTRQTATELIYSLLQKQPPETVCKKLFSYKFRNIYRKTPVLRFRFIKVVGLLVCNLIKKRLQHRSFPVSNAKFPRVPILKDIRERLLLLL